MGPGPFLRFLINMKKIKKYANLKKKTLKREMGYDILKKTKAKEKENKNESSKYNWKNLI